MCNSGYRKKEEERRRKRIKRKEEEEKRKKEKKEKRKKEGGREESFTLPTSARDGILRSARTCAYSNGIFVSTYVPQKPIEQ